MKKLIFLLLLIIPIACSGQGRHKNGVYVISANGQDTAFISADTAYIEIWISDGGAVTGIFMDTASIYIRDDDAGIGMQYFADYSPGYTDRSPVDREYNNTHLGGQDLNVTIYSPTDSEHGGLVMWDTNCDCYVSVPSVPVGSAAGLIVEKIDTVLFSNTDQTTMVTLPVGAVIHEVFVYVATTFNGSGTDQLDIGITGSEDRYESNLDIAVGASFPAMSLTNIRDRMGANTNITFDYDDSNADASAGEAYVYVHYSLPQ